MLLSPEQLSTFGREWLTQQALGMLRNQPLTGVGIGSFIIELSSYAVEGAIIEPVHNIFLLAASELGIPGLVLVIGLFISIAWNIFKTQTPRAVLASAAVAGLGVISLFDHYLWTLAPGRILLGLALTLVAGGAAFGVGWRIAGAALLPTAEITAQAEAPSCCTPTWAPGTAARPGASSSSAISRASMPSRWR